MLSTLLRLIALRPFLGMGILGVPIIALLAIGLMVVFAVKAVVALIIPLTLVLAGFWVIRRMARR